MGISLIEKGINFALSAHHGQMRKQTTIPYVVHPLSVGFLLQKYGYNEETITAGILHDVLEDTQATYEQLVDEFGLRVANLVEAASEKDKTLPWKVRKLHTVQTIHSLSKNGAAIVCADKLNNLSSIKEEGSRIGEEVWNRFNSGKEEQDWYYQSIATQLYRTEVEKNLLLAFDQTVQKVFGQDKNLSFKEIDSYFEFPYGVADSQLEEWDNEPHGKIKAIVYRRLNTLYVHQDERVFNLLNYLQQCGLEFQTNSDSPILIGCLGLSLMEQYQMNELEIARHIFRNLKKL
ncbi:HD domain-containing protein [Peribacillus asahii]|uniref:HD domain-containing protein n=1 Tax=Peribacillus asahii TaxID=228899 RepID=UPI001FE52DD8|nr:HD domain-containing protein [Peribacillus asahii]